MFFIQIVLYILVNFPSPHLSNDIVLPQQINIEELISQADSVLEKDNIAAAAEVEIIFEAANILAAYGDKEKALIYFEKALQLSPWNMEQQLNYSKLLKKQGDSIKSDRIASMVFNTTEQQSLLEEASAIANIPALNYINELPAETMKEKCFCFVKIGNVDDFILQRLGYEIAKTLGTPVYYIKKEIKLPDCHRDNYPKWEKATKENICNLIYWDEPIVKKTMKKLGIAHKDSATFDQIIELYAMLLEAGGQDNIRTDLLNMKADAIDRLKQWDASKLVEKLIINTPSKKNVIFVGITNADLFSNDSNFVFGQAGYGVNHCIISALRFSAKFNQEVENQNRFIDRLYKQAMSSIGFTLRVPRPTDPRSARSYPNSLSQHDEKGTWLSLECIEGFEKALGHPLPGETIEATKKALQK